MKVVICGGRSYRLTPNDLTWLDAFHAEHVISEVITGGASGADTDATQWAETCGINRVIFPANWAGDGKKAGPLRNSRMLWYLETPTPRRSVFEPLAVIAFPGVKGTEHMCGLARNRGMIVRYPHKESLLEG